MRSPISLILGAIAIGIALTCKRGGGGCHCNCGSLQQQINDLQRLNQELQHKLDIQKAESDRLIRECHGDMKTLENRLGEEIAENHKDLQRLNLRAGMADILEKWNKWNLDRAVEVEKKSEEKLTNEQERHDKLLIHKEQECTDQLQYAIGGGVVTMVVLVAGWVFTHIISQHAMRDVLQEANETTQKALESAQDASKTTKIVAVALSQQGVKQKTVQGATPALAGAAQVTRRGQPQRQGHQTDRNNIRADSGQSINITYQEEDGDLVENDLAPGLRSRRFSVRLRCQDRTSSDKQLLDVFVYRTDKRDNKLRFLCFDHSNWIPMFLNSIDEFWLNFL